MGGAGASITMWARSPWRVLPGSARPPDGRGRQMWRCTSAPLARTSSRDCRCRRDGGSIPAMWSCPTATRCGRTRGAFVPDRHGIRPGRHVVCAGGRQYVAHPPESAGTHPAPGARGQPHRGRRRDPGRAAWCRSPRRRAARIPSRCSLLVLIPCGLRALRFHPKVLQAFRSPERYPSRNQLRRCSADPWVHDSGFTRPCACCWMRSSPTASAAPMAC